MAHAQNVLKTITDQCCVETGLEGSANKRLSKVSAVGQKERMVFGQQMLDTLSGMLTALKAGRTERKRKEFKVISVLGAHILDTCTPKGHKKDTAWWHTGIYEAGRPQPSSLRGPFCFISLAVHKDSGHRLPFGTHNSLPTSSVHQGRLYPTAGYVPVGDFDWLLECNFTVLTEPPLLYL